MPHSYAISKGKSYSYILQFAISLGQLYGTAVYFITALLEGDNFAVSPLYYYAYYVVMNSFWIVIPTAISIRCWKKTCAAFNNQGQKKVKSRWGRSYCLLHDQCIIYLWILSCLIAYLCFAIDWSLAITSIFCVCQLLEGSDGWVVEVKLFQVTIGLFDQWLWIWYFDVESFDLFEALIPCYFLY